MQLSGASASRESGQEGAHGIAPEVLARLSAASDHAVFAAAWLDAIASLTDSQLLTRTRDGLVFDNPFFSRWVAANAVSGE